MTPFSVQRAAGRHVERSNRVPARVNKRITAIGCEPTPVELRAVARGRWRKEIEVEVDVELVAKELGVGHCRDDVGIRGIRPHPVDQRIEVLPAWQLILVVVGVEHVDAGAW